MASTLQNADKVIGELALRKARNIYALGVFDRQITLYKQQLRATNLAFALHERHLRKASSKPIRVAVIGAGASGVTFSAAMLILGHEVVLFEHQAEMMYLQKGCETRHLHPNSYDWPDLGSDIPYADLPFLNWRASTAKSVIRQIQRQFDAIVEHANNLPGHKAFTFWPRSIVHVDKKGMVDWQSLSVDDGKRQSSQAGIEHFSHLVLAVGFGIESEVDDDRNISYWRNDSFNQIRASSYAASRADYWVSGVGDGALIDVQRLTIRDYDQSRFPFDVWTAPPPKASVSSSELRALKAKIDRKARTLRGDDAYYKAIEYASGDPAIQILDDYLDERRLRSDTFVILNGEDDSFKKVLKHGKQSFLNLLVCHRLYNKGAFVYIDKRLTPSETGWKHPMLVHHQSAKIILRHGSDRFKNLNDCGWKISRHPLTTKKRVAPERQWPVGWWQKNATAHMGKLVRGTRSERVEFHSPDLQLLCESYVSALSGLIGNYDALLSPSASSKSTYRACMHRVVRIQGKPYFQQITNYFGNSPESGRIVGRVFDLNSGFVGLACRLRRSIVVRIPATRGPKVRRNRERVRQLWRNLKLAEVSDTGGMHPPPREARTFIAIPILMHSSSPSPAGGDDEKVGFVLYLDSSIALFDAVFNRSPRTAETPAMLKFIETAFKPFRDNLLKMIGEKRAFFNDVDVPKPEWNYALSAMKRFHDLMHSDRFVLRFPNDITSDVTLNRFVERGL